MSILFCISSIPSGSWSLFLDHSRSIRSFIVLRQKSLLLVNLCWVFLLQNGIQLLQLFGVKVSIDGLTIHNELTVNYLLIISPVTDHHLVFKSLMFCIRFGRKPLYFLRLQKNNHFSLHVVSLLRKHRSHGFSSSFLQTSTHLCAHI